MHGVRKELSQRRIMTTSSLSITGDIEGISLHIANDLLLFIFIRVVHSGLPFVIQNGDNQGICKKAWAAQFTVLQVLLYLLDFYKYTLYTKISLVIWQDIGYTLHIPI